MDRSIGGSRFHCGCAVVSLAPGGPGTGRRAAGPRRTNNRGMRRGVRWGDAARYAFSIPGRIRFSEPKSVGVVRHSPNNPGTFSWLSMPNAVDLVFAGEGA